MDRYHLHNSWNSNSDMDNVDCTGNTSKSEEIHQNSVKGAVTPVWSSLVEIETMKDKNKESRIADIESSDASSEDIEQENVDEDLDQETCKNNMDSTFLSMFDNNVKDSLETNCGSSMNESEVSNDEVYECKFCHASFTENISVKSNILFPYLTINIFEVASVLLCNILG
ncbi:hypothetical protein GQR58_019662 [Nymphon striatum]|nr:hypothetical protein GQR58_019662 [Nymphon striatum]